MTTVMIENTHASPAQSSPPGLCRRMQAWIAAMLALVASLALPMSPAQAWSLHAEAKLYNRDGNQVGMARLVQRSDHVLVQVHVHDLAPGFHGFHVHAAGVCLLPYTSAGGHFDMDKHTHGHHSGDLPILLVDADGRAEAKYETDRFTVADLFDADGSAIIIHANPDNYANIPTRYAAAPDASTLATGDAGDRIACGVVEKHIER